MEKRLERESSTLHFQKSHPSCIRGIFSFFDFHQRLHIRKMLSDKKHGSRRHAGGFKNAKTKLDVSATGEPKHFMNEELDCCSVEDEMKDSSPSKQFGHACIKTLIAEEMSKERKQKRRTSSFSARLLRTESIHYADYDPDEKPSTSENPSIELCPHETSSSTNDNRDPLLPKPPEDLITSNKHCDVCGAMNGGGYSDRNQLDVTESNLLEKQMLLEKLLEAKEELLKHSQSKEFLEALQIFNANRELLLKILQDPNYILSNHSGTSPSREVVLTKCGSFPGAEFPGMKNLELMKLNHKQREIRSISKQEERFQSQNSLSNMKNVESDGNYSKSTTSTIDEDGGTPLESLPGSSHELKNEKNNRAVLNRFKDIKQKLKHAIKESKKERLRISMDGILHKIPYGRKPSKDAKSVVDSPGNSYETDGAASFSGKNALSRFRRTPSLNESLDRYSQLFDSVLSKDGKAGLSEGLKSEHGDGVLPQARCSKKTFGRILSLPEMYSYNPVKDVDGEASHDAVSTGMLSRIAIDDGNAEVKSCGTGEQKPADTPVNAEAESQIESFVENGSRDDFVKGSTSGALDGAQDALATDTDAYGNAEVGGIGDDLDELATVQKSSYIPPHEQEIGSVKDVSAVVQPSPISVLGSCFAEDVMTPVKSSFSEAGSELHPRQIGFNDVNLQTEADVHDSVEPREDVDEIETPSEHADYDIAHVQVDIDDEADFKYVRDILKKSRFSIDESLGTWYLPDQPVDPSLFDEVECFTSEHNSRSYEFGDSCNHMLLFDLINEVLLEIYTRTFMYCPWYLCRNSSIRPMPVGTQVLEEVWASISWHLSSKLLLDPTLDDIVARDLAKNDGWMNIQPEAVCVGLEMEDWILDDLLDEVTYDIAGF